MGGLLRSSDMNDDTPNTDELLGWLEFAFWVVLGLAPVFYWVNGPAVSGDQFVVRIVLLVLAALGAVSLHMMRRFRKRR